MTPTDQSSNSSVSAPATVLTLDRPQTEIPAPVILAIIAAVVRFTFGTSARIAQIVPLKGVTPSVDMAMSQWSMEGRRLIYSSHQIR